MKKLLLFTLVSLVISFSLALPSPTDGTEGNVKEEEDNSMRKIVLEEVEEGDVGERNGPDMRTRADLDLMLNDMGMSPGQSSQAGIAGDYYRWPNRVVAYEVDPAFNQGERNVIYSAMYDIQGKTCIRFKPRTYESDWVYIQRGGGGCWSWIGRQGGRQILTLKPPSFNGDSHCIWSGTAAHELIHAIGFYHEQTRPDRDDWVSINWANIHPNMRSNFAKLSWSDTSTFSVPYDYRSIMHYDAHAFAINSNVQTIFPKQSGAFLGNHVVSPSDARKINYMYGC